MMKLWKVYYRYGTSYCDLFVLADSESNMLRTVCKDGDAEIIKYEEIDLNDSENRVL